MFALITGASNGIGYELARTCAREKYNLILVARRQDKLLELKKDLEKEYTNIIHVITLDLANPTAADQLFDQVKKLNISVDVLVNNAGFGQYGLFTTTDPVEEQEMIRLNIATLTRLTKLYLPEMIARKTGKILNVASTAAFQPGPYMAVYFATKAYVLLFSEALAEELKNTGVTVTALCPGPTATGFRKVAQVTSGRMFKKVSVTAREVAEYGYQSLMRGKTVAIYGFKNKVMVFAERFLPRKIIAALVKNLQQ